MKQKIVRRASALVLAGCLLAGAALPALCGLPPRKRSSMPIWMRPAP